MLPRVALLVIAIALLAISPGIARIQDGDPGTIGDCLTKPDGTTVTLACEQVLWRGGSGKSFAIKEWFEKQPLQPRIMVTSTLPLAVESGWSVDVTGTLDTFTGTSEDGTPITQRVLMISPENVQVYCDTRGKPVLFVPIKGTGMTWPNKLSLSELAGSTSRTLAAMSTLSSDPPPIPDPPTSSATPPAEGSRDSLKWLPDGAAVSINGAIVLASFQDYFCVETSDRSFGIRVISWEWPAQGSLVDIDGVLTTVGGERVLQASSVTSVDSNTYPCPTPIMMPNKSIGGGAVGAFTPAVADAAGLNNTGLLVRTCGTVTYADYGNLLFYVDDGSAIAADSGHTGIKVYETDPWSWDFPSENDYVTIAGIPGAEIPSGSSSSIRILRKIVPTTSATQPGSGTITGTITATGASGKCVRVYCASASTTATFSGNTASYTLSVPYGDHAVTATVVGYKTITQLATVSSGTPVTRNFTLPTLDKIIDVVPAQRRIAPDGTSETLVTAIVRDEEGRRIGGETITWGLDLGTLVSSESSTSAVGEATATVRSTANHETATVTAQVGSLVGCGWVEYGNPSDPSILPVSPHNGEALSGGVYITYWLGTPYGGIESLSTIEVFIDGQSTGLIGPDDPSTYWETFTSANGTHTIRARLTDTNGNSMYSPVTTVETDNHINTLQVTPDEFDPGLGEQATITASLKESANWQLTIKDTSGSNTVYTATGTGSTVSCTWDGATALNEDVFQYTITVTSGSQSGASATGWVGKKVIPDNQVEVLSAAGKNLPYWPIRYSPMYDYAKQRGFKAKKLPPKAAKWARISSILSYGNCRMFYINCHAKFSHFNWGGTAYDRTWIIVGDRQVLSYRSPASPNVAIEDLGLENSDQMRFVWLDGCQTGYYGSTSGMNDMARAFGMYSNSNMIWGDQTYCGWKDASGDPPTDYQDWCRELLYRFKDSGRPLERAIFLTYWSDPSTFDYIYNDNFVTYGGDSNLSYLTTFFEIY